MLGLDLEAAVTRAVADVDAALAQNLDTQSADIPLTAALEDIVSAGGNR